MDTFSAGGLGTSKLEVQGSLGESSEIFITRLCGVGSQVRKNKIKFLPSNKISEIQHKKYLALYSSLQSDWLTRADRIEVRSKNFKMSFSISSSQLCSHTPSALNAGAKRSGATCHMAMPQCCYLAKGAKRPSHTTNMKHFFGLVQPKFIFGLLQPKFIFGLVQPKFIFGLVNSRLCGVGSQAYIQELELFNVFITTVRLVFRQTILHL